MTITNKPIKTAVITGGHHFDVPAFIDLFRSMNELDFYPQTLENFAADVGGVRLNYEALVFYNMHSELTKATQAVYEALGETSQGLVFLHHAILAFPDWPHMEAITGYHATLDFTYLHDETLQVQIAMPDHPITRGLNAWQMVDETYMLPDVGLGNQVLLTTDHPRSMRTLAWTRGHKKARVFVFTPGHERSLQPPKLSGGALG
jgi:type 1 glutamine amidotransferase